ncbi:FliH/SctL family protein [Paenibacillus endoradicis]|uniref:FliH/SctL family protein n=1 Tax=Paenibacillus endoradicis TaxID=2972487 RepID=UPI0021599E4C|nr:FliH/SctL family protein [Paenibacillus endoradicis]MCR8656250.1 FliH/SctL family protein [Paenibacillus endoradicis]
MSNLIKSSHVMTLEELRKLRWNNQYIPQHGETDREETSEPVEVSPDATTISLRDQILSDAMSTAEARISEAANECEKLLEDANAQIEVWWLEKRNEDEAIKEKHQEEGHQQGYQSGMVQAQQEVRAEWEHNLEEASTILKDAYRTREQIIQEAEPFIVELSCSIAEKVIGRQLSLEPEMVLDIITRTLSRRREQGEITLCVSPANLSFVQAAREELNATIDSQAELVIIPDSSVKDEGCVIRSKFGSIDARIDTQLSEIKRELLLIAHQSIEERGQTNDAD